MVFISYSKTDAAWKDMILSHLMENENIHGRKVTFCDSEIEAGDDFQKAIEFNVASVTAAVLLVSNNYLKSEYIRINELEPLLRRKNIKVYWFLLSVCLWDTTKLATLQCANIINGERLCSLNELAETNRNEAVRQILSIKCKEIYRNASQRHVPLKSPRDFVYKCNRSVESRHFKLIYTDCFNEKSLLAYSIVGDKDDALPSLHNAIKLKTLVSDYKNYDITDFLIPSINLGYGYTKAQDLLVFKTDFFSKLDIPYDPSKVKSLAVGHLYEHLRRQLSKESPKQVYFISIKIESTDFYEESFLEVLRWLNDPMEQLSDEAHSLKIFLLFIFEKSNCPDADAKMMKFLAEYCKYTHVEHILRGEANPIDLYEDCLDLIFLGEHKTADRRALNEWYERDYKYWFISNNIPLPEETDAEFENVKAGIFNSCDNVKMRVVEKTLTTFLKY
jgi:hypothetical protein